MRICDGREQHGASPSTSTPPIIPNHVPNIEQHTAFCFRFITANNSAKTCQVEPLRVFIMTFLDGLGLLSCESPRGVFNASPLLSHHETGRL